MVGVCDCGGCGEGEKRGNEGQLNWALLGIAAIYRSIGHWEMQIEILDD